MRALAYALAVVLVLLVGLAVYVQVVVGDKAGPGSKTITPEQLRQAAEAGGRMAHVAPSPSLALPATPAVSPMPREVFRVGGDVTAPIELPREPFQVPERLRVANADGLVILELLVEADGSVSSVSLLRSVDRRSQGCVAFLTERLSHWRYEPATHQGRPVAAYITITLLHCPCCK